jgi:RNA polymerase sigma-70 factor (ECF subfamily)
MPLKFSVCIDSALSTWIYRIAMNESLRFLNKKEIKVVSADNVHDELIDSLKASDYIDYEDISHVLKLL